MQALTPPKLTIPAAGIGKTNARGLDERTDGACPGKD